MSNIVVLGPSVGDGAGSAQDLERPLLLSAFLQDHREQVEPLGLGGEIGNELFAERLGVITFPTRRRSRGSHGWKSRRKGFGETGAARLALRRFYELGLSKITPKAMRRTWKDVARTAGIEKVIRRAVSGTYTDAMEDRYSTARSGEKRSALAKVVSINTARAKKSTTGAA